MITSGSFDMELYTMEIYMNFNEVTSYYGLYTVYSIDSTL